MNNQAFGNDEFTEKLIQEVFPSNWKNPKPAEMYDLLVLGGGPGGMQSTTIARSLGAKVAIVEKTHLGGECLNAGCIPSKAMLRSSRIAADIRDAKEYGIDVSEWKINIPAIMQRVHRLQSTFAGHDSAEHFDKMGADVFLGEGKFTGDNQLEIAGQIINFKKAIIVTGTNPLPFNVPGVGPADYLTNQNVFRLSTFPKRLGVIGAGPVSCELSQAFCRFGAEVTLVTRGKRLLTTNDELATDRLQKLMTKEGLRIVFNSYVQRVEVRKNEKVIYLENGQVLTVDTILTGIGRYPNVIGLELEKAKISYDQQRGIKVNEYLQTSNPNIYAAGDVCYDYKFTHISKELAKIAVINALNGNQIKDSALIIPRCTYTDPEIGQAGPTEKEARDKGIPLDTILVELTDIDRAVIDGESVGFAKIYVKAGTDKIIGATFMARHAGEMISEATLAIASNKGLLDLARNIHPFPTQCQIFRTAAEMLLKKREKAADPSTLVGFPG